MADKERKIQTIQTRVRTVLDPKNSQSVKYDDLVSKYVGGGAAAIVAFVDELNKYPPFKKDGLTVFPSDVPDNPQVYEITAAVVGNYKKRGWTITV